MAASRSRKARSAIAVLVAAGFDSDGLYANASTEIFKALTSALAPDQALPPASPREGSDR